MWGEESWFPFVFLLLCIPIAIGSHYTGKWLAKYIMNRDK